MWVDRVGVVHRNGDPKYAEEFEERVRLGFQSLSKTDQGS